MLEIIATQVRSKHAANWPLIGCVVRMPAYVAIHRTYVQTGAAPNAGQDFPFLGIREQAAAAVVQQDNVKFFRAIGFAGAARSPDQSAVSGNRLTCA